MEDAAMFNMFPLIDHSIVLTEGVDNSFALVDKQNKVISRLNSAAALVWSL